MIELEKKGEIDTPENKLRFARFRREVSEIQGVANQIFQFENDPKEGGEFFSSTYQTIFDLDASTAKSLNSIFSEQIAVAKERGLTLVNSPSYKVRAGEGESLTESEEKAWYTQREDFFSEVRTQLRDQFPIEKQEDFDRLVEEGDIGFNVLKVKGMNLSLSFRGSH